MRLCVVSIHQLHSPRITTTFSTTWRLRIRKYSGVALQCDATIFSDPQNYSRLLITVIFLLSKFTVWIMGCLVNPEYTPRIMQEITILFTKSMFQHTRTLYKYMYHNWHWGGSHLKCKSNAIFLKTCRHILWSTWISSMQNKWGVAMLVFE